MHLQITFNNFVLQPYVFSQIIKYSTFITKTITKIYNTYSFFYGTKSATIVIEIRDWNTSLISHSKNNNNNDIVSKNHYYLLQYLVTPTVSSGKDTFSANLTSFTKWSPPTNRSLYRYRLIGLGRFCLNYKSLIVDKAHNCCW